MLDVMLVEAVKECKANVLLVYGFSNLISFHVLERLMSGVISHRKCCKMFPAPCGCCSLNRTYTSLEVVIDGFQIWLVLVPPSTLNRRLHYLLFSLCFQPWW